MHYEQKPNNFQEAPNNYESYLAALLHKQINDFSSIARSVTETLTYVHFYASLSAVFFPKYFYS